MIDQLSINYNGNQLIAVDDDNLYDNGYDFHDNGHYYLHGTNDTIEYRYDANGNMISETKE